jgi:hypothetical protein
MGMGGLKTALAPLLVIFAVTPLLVMVVLFFVAVLMTPALSAWSGGAAFPSWKRSTAPPSCAARCGLSAPPLLAAIAMIASLPLWLIPPLILVLPPLIWGWLTYRVMAFDALAEHASGDERRLLFKRHRLTLLAMGVGTGYLGAAPSMVWASGWFFAAAFPILIPIAIWIYTLVFAFSALWFAHFCLAALQQLRAEISASPMAVQPHPVALADDRPFRD